MNIIMRCYPPNHYTSLLYRVIGPSCRRTSTSATGKLQPTKTPTKPSSSATAPPARNSGSAATGEHMLNEPIAYFGSGASSFKARVGHSGGKEGQLWYQPYVISGSLAVFLLYFCVLREESDIDQKLDGNLFDHVAGLEETQLMLAYDYNIEHGLPTEALEQRLIELQQSKGA